jgi:15-cis-phytoene synthase
VKGAAQRRRSWIFQPPAKLSPDPGVLYGSGSERCPSVTAAPSADRLLSSAYAECEKAIRAADRDRWLASLFAPANVRPYLHALYAFNLEIARVRDLVSDPLPGEMRLQWWRDAIDGVARGDVSGYPQAAALLDTIQRFQLPTKPLLDMIEARTFDLYDDVMPTIIDLEGYCGETSSALIRYATIILAGGDDPPCAECAGHAGVAYALTGLLRAFAWSCARGQVYLPEELMKRYRLTRDKIIHGSNNPALQKCLNEVRALAWRHLAETRRQIGAAKGTVAVAFLPVSLVAPYLAQMERRDYDPYHTRIEIPQWRRQWIIWASARRAARG